MTGPHALCSALVSLALCSCATTSSSNYSSGGSAPAASPAAYQTLKTINDRVNEARAGLLQKVGADLKKEKDTIAAASAKLAEARRQYTPALRSQTAAYSSVGSNLFDAENWVANSQAAWETESSLQEAEASHARGAPLTDAQLSALEQKAKLFEDKARVEWKNAAVEQLRRARALAFAMPVAMPGGAKAAAAPASTSAATTTTTAAAQPAPAPAPAPVKRDGLPPRLEAILDGAWANDEDKAAGDALATAFKVTLVKVARAPLKGDTKHAELTVEAKDGQCYLVPFVLSTGEIPRDASKLQYGVTVQSFALESPPAQLVLPTESGARGQEGTRDGRTTVYGFCALKAGKVTMALDAAEAPGSKTTLRHAILTFPRATLPDELLGYITIGAQFDKCEADQLTSYFLKPVPSTLAYLENEPVVLTRVGTDKLGVLHMNGQITETPIGKWAPGWLEKTGVTAVAAIGKLKFPPLGELGGCPDNEGRGIAFSAQSKKIAECYAKADKKKTKDEIDQLCQPLIKKAEANMKKAYDDIVDEFAEKKPANPVSHKWITYLRGQPKQ